MNVKIKKETKFNILDKTKNNSEQRQGGNDSEYGKEKQKLKEDVKPNDPLSGTVQTQFNKNRKIIIRNVPPVTYEVISCSLFCS